MNKLHLAMFNYNKEPWQWDNFTGQNLSKKDAIHIFKFHKSIYPSIEDNLANVLSTEDLAKKNRFFKEDDAIRFTIGKYFTRIILGQHFLVAPKNINFKTTKTGKPYLPEIHFNISHSLDYIFLVISKQEIGIDTEFIKKDFDYALLKKECFTVKEQNLIKKPKHFYYFWTRKEAILKATGEGLLDNLHDLECVENEVKRCGNLYLLQSILIKNDYILSIASRNTVWNLNFWEFNDFSNF